MNVGSNIQDQSSKLYKIVEILSSGTKKQFYINYAVIVVVVVVDFVHALVYA